MKIKLVGSSVGASDARQFLSSSVINDSISLDAGGLGLMLPLEDQIRVRHAILSHSHLDHIASLPLFLENHFLRQSGTVTVYGERAVLDCLQQSLFNNRVWPDVLHSSGGEPSTVHIVPIEPNQSLDIDGVQITPVRIDHVVPTLGFVVQDDAATVAVVSDTGPTEEIWRIASGAQNLRGVFLEASFPNRLAALAQVSKHLTPQLFARELKKLDVQVPVIAIHVKPALHDEIVSELMSLDLPDLKIGSPGMEYFF